MPLQRGQAMLVDSPIEGRNRWRDSSSRPKRERRPIWNARAVLSHGVAQAVFDRALILLRLHVDEVDDDQAAQVAQAQLPRRSHPPPRGWC
jgi:hypothetical protein